MKKATFAIAFALIFVFSMAAIIHPANGLDSVNEDSTKMTIMLNETVDFWVDVKPTSLVEWFCNDVLVQSEFATHSNYTFIPKSPGIYYIDLSVDGFTKPSGPRKVTVLEEPVVTPTATQTSPPSFIHYYNDTHFALRQTLWAFDGEHNIGSFAATDHDYLEFNIQTTNADPDRPDDLFIVEFKIESRNHNSSYVSGTTFNQKIKLNYTDAYTISFWKHPFFASVNVVGSIDLHRGIAEYSSPTQTPEPSNTPVEAPTKNLSLEKNLNFDWSFPAIMLGMIGIGILIILFVSAIYINKRRTKPLTTALTEKVAKC